MAPNDNQGQGAEHGKQLLRAALYARISPLGDLEPEANFSIDGQLDEMRELVKQQGWVSGRELEFRDEHVSGKDLDRPGLDAMQLAIDRREVDVVVFHSPDRMARKLAHQLVLAEGFKKRNIKLAFVRSKFEDTPEGRMAFQMQGVFAEFEREKIRERTSRGRRRKARAGHITAPIPAYGFRYIRGDKKLRQYGRWEIDDRESPVVDVIFRLVAAAYSQRAVCRYLKENSLRPRRAEEWATATINQIIRNTAYKGQNPMNSMMACEPKQRRKPKSRSNSHTWRPEEQWIWVDVPRLISDELWQQANDALDVSKAKHVGCPTVSHLLSGYLFCSKCGKRCIVQPNRGKPIYQCGNRDRNTGTPGCDARRTTRADRIEALVWDAVMDCLTDARVLAELIDQCRRPNDIHQQRQDKLRADIVSLDKVMMQQRRKIQDPRFADEVDYWDDELLKSKATMKELKREFDLLAAQNIPIVSTLDLERIAEQARKYRHRLGFDFRRARLKHMVDKILYYADSQEIDIKVKLPVYQGLPEEESPLHSNWNYHQGDTSNSSASVSPSFSFTIRRSVAA